MITIPTFIENHIMNDFCSVEIRRYDTVLNKWANYGSVLCLIQEFFSDQERSLLSWKTKSIIRLYGE